MKKIIDMNWQEWKEAIANNSVLAGELEEMAISNAEYWINDYLHGFSDTFAGDYQIRQYGYSYVKIFWGELPDFTKWFNRVQRDYCLFAGSDEKDIEEYINVANDFFTADFGDDDNAYLNMEEKVEKLQEHVENIILRRLKSEYDIDEDVLLDFVEEWIDRTIGYRSETEDEYYLHDDYTIVHHVPRHVVEAYEVRVV